jgi:hypothetical protein
MLIVPPIPIQRLYYNDDSTSLSIKRQTYKIAGCGCTKCKSNRNELMTYCI